MNYFAYPHMFWLLALPLIVFLLLPKIKGLHGDALRVPFLKDLKYIKNRFEKAHLISISSNVLFSLKFLYLFIIWGLLTIAAARPQLVGEPFRLKAENRDIMLVVDISTSMLQPDFATRTQKLDRLSAIKAVVGNFLNQRKNDRIGLILFGTRAYLQSPLTFDREAVREILYNTDAGMAGNSTAIGDALGIALKNLKDEQNKKNKVIILLTDGENNDGSLDMEQVIDMAEKEGIKIYTIGVGADISFFNLFNVANNALDEKSLKTLAQKTNGTYFRAKDLNSLIEIYQRIDNLEPSDNEDSVVQEKHDLFYIPLLLALLLALFAIVIPRSYVK